MSITSNTNQLGRYILCDQIAAGGMATVHFGRMHGAVGFSRIVAIKRLHSNFASDPHFVQMFMDEARLAARLRHPNVVSTLDVVANDSEVFLVMEYVLGESLERVMFRNDKPVPIAIASAIMCGVLEGLHSAHDARSDLGEPLGIVHRDVSPHNVLVGQDGVARVFDFGIAKAANNTQETRDGVVKGKVSYMAPEQIRGDVDRRADVYAAGVILWELLVGRRRHNGERSDMLFLKLAKNELEPPPPASSIRAEIPSALDEVIIKATAALPEDRFESARDMALALEKAAQPAQPREVSEWLRQVAGEHLDRLAAIMQRIEASADGSAEMLVGPSPTSMTGMRAAGTGSFTRSGVTRSVSGRIPVDGTGRMSAPPVKRRNWTIPAAFIAFAATLLLVGLRTIHRVQPQLQAQPDRAGGSPTGGGAEGDPNGTSRPSSGTQPTITTLTNGADPGSLGATPAVTHPANTGSASGANGNTTPNANANAAKAWTPPKGASAKSTPAPAAAAAKSAHGAPEAPVTASAPAPKPAATPAKANCDTPFMIGPDGIRQIKPECM